MSGEHVFPWMFEEFGALAPLREAAELLAEHPWPRLYDRAVMAANTVPAAAAIYAEDMYVEREFSEQTAAQVRGLKNLGDRRVRARRAARRRGGDPGPPAHDGRSLTRRGLGERERACDATAMSDLSMGEAARALDVSVDTLRRWDSAGKLRTTRDERNRRRVPASEVERLGRRPRKRAGHRPRLGPQPDGRGRPLGRGRRRHGARRGPGGPVHPGRRGHPRRGRGSRARGGQPDHRRRSSRRWSPSRADPHPMA